MPSKHRFTLTVTTEAPLDRAGRRGQAVVTDRWWLATRLPSGC